jgi:hypothetical protein
MATVNMFTSLVRAEVRKAQAVITELQLPAMKAGRSKEEAELMKSSYPSSPAKASWAEVKAARDAAYRIANSNGNEYLSSSEWAEWKELTSIIPSSIRVGGAMYRSLKVRKDTLVSLRASLANAKKAEAETLTRLANEFFNACVEAGIDVSIDGFETSQLSLRAQRMAVAESRRVFVYSLKLAEKSRLESAGYEVWLDSGLCVANGSIQTREASAQSATRRGKTAHLTAASNRHIGRVVWQDGVNTVSNVTKELQVTEEKELVATVEETKTAMRNAEINFKSVAGKLEALCAKSLEVKTEEEFVAKGYEEQYNILSEEFDLAELAYNDAVDVYNQAIADGGVFKTIYRHMLVVKPVEKAVVVKKDKVANRQANLDRAKAAQAHRASRHNSNGVIKLMVEDHRGLLLAYLQAIVNGDKELCVESFNALVNFKKALQRKLYASGLRRGSRPRSVSGKGRKNKN